MKLPASAAIAVVGSLVFVTGACGSSSDSETATTAVAATVAPTTLAPTTAAPAPTAAPTTAAPATTVPAIMPEVVCMNLQDAQNKIQENGVFFSDSFDASGEGRMQINDSNWIVVSQTPAAGSIITEGSANLGAVKGGEPNPC